MKKGLQELVKSIEDLKKESVSSLVKQRMNEFQKIRHANSDEIFFELCFCILTANCSAESCIKVQCEVGDRFRTLPEEKLAALLKKVGYRFPNKRASYIVLARGKIGQLIRMLSSEKNGGNAREFIVANIKGLGMKEASHFLRNVGFGDVAIIDFHIIDILVEYGVISEPKALTKNKYLEIEEELAKMAKKTNLSLGELDLYLWYAETGKILK